MICSICLQNRTALKFRTGRLSICGFCVRLLNTTALSPREAKQHWREGFRFAIVHAGNHTVEEVDGWRAEWWNNMLAESMDNPERVRHSSSLKVLRAYRGGLVCLDHRYLDYPSNWEFKRFRLKHWDHDACYICHAREADGAKLHVHHIVHRSHSGTNSYRNLVALCFQHHQAQHSHPIGQTGGEARGTDVDNTPSDNDAWREDDAGAVVAVPWELEVPVTQRSAIHFPRSDAAQVKPEAPPTPVPEQMPQQASVVERETAEHPSLTTNNPNNVRRYKDAKRRNATIAVISLIVWVIILTLSTWLH